MIDGIGKSGSAGRVEPVRTAVERSAAIAPSGDAVGSGKARGPGAAISDMAAMGAPVDEARVAAVKAAIAAGNYPVDPDKIADRMIALDLPRAKP